MGEPHCPNPFYRELCSAVPRNHTLAAVYSCDIVKSTPLGTLCLEVEILPGFQQCVSSALSLSHLPYITVSFGADLHACGRTVASCSPALLWSLPLFWLSNPLSSPHPRHSCLLWCGELSLRNIDGLWRLWFLTSCFQINRRLKAPKPYEPVTTVDRHWKET